MKDTFLQFKFRTINKYLIESLVNPSIYFATPAELNDPFDCRLNLRRSFQRAASYATDNRKKWLHHVMSIPNFIENFDSLINSVGVCSFSSIMEETLLWSHYADQHRGVCLTYEFPTSFLLDTQFKLTVGGPVIYMEEPLTEWLRNGPIEDMELESFVKELLHILLKTKSPSWAYEKEARLIRSKSGDCAICGAFMKQVCFGLQTPQRDIDLIIRLSSDYCGCTRFARMVSDETDFGFIIRPYQLR